MAERRDSFAVGAARAAGERRRRSSTPLVAGSPIGAPPSALSADPGSSTVAPPSLPMPVPAGHAGPQHAGPQRAEPAVADRPDAQPPTRHPAGTPVPSPTGPLTRNAAHPPETDRQPGPPARSRPHRPVPNVTPTAAPAATAIDAVDRQRRGRLRPGGSFGDPSAAHPSRHSRSEADRAGSRPAGRDTDEGRPRPSRAGQPTTDAPEPPRFRPRIVRPDDPPPPLDDALLAAALGQQELAPDIEDVVAAGIGILRTVAAASGLSTEQAEAVIARTLAFTRRRLTGDYEVDDFGFDSDYTAHVFLPLARVLYQKWFRVEVRGIENIPSTGSALIVANHSGTVALDAQMLQVAVHDEHPAERHLRLLGADLVFKTPVMGALARKQGATLAANSDAERLLGSGEIVGVFPEGFKGVGKPFTERYKLQRFGRGGFVSAAVRTGTPIIPCSIVGAEETYPLLGDVTLLARLIGAPYFPITPTWPWLGLLGLVPLPSKWIMEFGEPVPTSQYGEGAADDPTLVFDLTDQIRETIQQTLYSLLMLRRSVFS